METKTNDSLNQAKENFNRGVQLRVFEKESEYPNSIEVAHRIKLLDNVMHWGREMVKHGATIEDFGEHDWIGWMAGAQKKSCITRWLRL